MVRAVCDLWSCKVTSAEKIMGAITSNSITHLFLPAKDFATSNAGDNDSLVSLDRPRFCNVWFGIEWTCRF